MSSYSLISLLFALTIGLVAGKVGVSCEAFSSKCLNANGVRSFCCVVVILSK